METRQEWDLGVGADLTAKLPFQPRPEGGEEGATGVHRGRGLSRGECNYQGPEGESTGMDVIAPNLPATFSPKIHSMPQPAGSDGAQRSREVSLGSSGHMEHHSARRRQVWGKGPHVPGEA